MNVQETIIGVVFVAVIVGAAVLWFFRRRTHLGVGIAALCQQARRLLVDRRGRPAIRIEAWSEEWIDWSIVEPASPAETRAVVDVVDIATKSGMAGVTGLGGLQRTVRIVFPPSVQAALKAGLARPMPAPGGGIYLDVLGQHTGIIGKGWLISSTTISPAAVAAAAWQVLAIVTAQHYLVLIDSSLKQLQSGIDDIKAWLDIEKVTWLQAALQYLWHVRDVITGGLFAEPDVVIFAGELERIWREACATEGLYQAFMDRERKKLSEMKLSGLLAADSRLAAANEHLHSYEGYANACLAALIVEAATLATRCSLPLPCGDAPKRLSDVRVETDAWREKVRDGFGGMIGRLDEVGPRVGNRASARDRWLKSIVDARSRAEDKYNRAQLMLRRVQQAVGGQARSEELPLEYIVKISDDGRPRQVWRYRPPQSA